MALPATAAATINRLRLLYASVNGQEDCMREYGVGVGDGDVVVASRGNEILLLVVRDMLSGRESPPIEFDSYTDVPRWHTPRSNLLPPVVQLTPLPSPSLASQHTRGTLMAGSGNRRDLLDTVGEVHHDVELVATLEDTLFTKHVQPLPQKALRKKPPAKGPWSLFRSTSQAAPKKKPPVLFDSDSDDGEGDSGSLNSSVPSVRRPLVLVTRSSTRDLRDPSTLSLIHEGLPLASTRSNSGLELGLVSMAARNRTQEYLSNIDHRGYAESDLGLGFTDSPFDSSDEEEDGDDLMVPLAEPLYLLLQPPRFRRRKARGSSALVKPLVVRSINPQWLDALQLLYPLDDTSDLEESQLQVLRVVPAPAALHRLVLSQLLQVATAQPDDPLDRFGSVQGTAANGQKLVVYMPLLPTPATPVITTYVSQEATVFETIGYLLFMLAGSDKVAEEQQNPNQWCLKIVDEDGEPYDGSLGLMDRTKRVSDFGADEVGLCEALELEYKQWAVETPYVAATAALLAHTLSHTDDVVEMKVFMYPYMELNFSTFHILIDATIQELLEHVCGGLQLEASQFQLRTIPQRHALNPDEKIEQLDNPNLELAQVGTGVRDPELGSLNTLGTLPLMMDQEFRALPPLKQLQNRRSRSGDVLASALSGGLPAAPAKSTAPSKVVAAPTNMAGMGVDVWQWDVYRRHPNMFNQKLECTLMVDGDYIHLLPAPDKRTWFDPNAKRLMKKRSIHLKDLVRVLKRSKYPTGLKIVATKEGRVKTYYLEASLEQECSQIIRTLQLVHEGYRAL